MEHDGCCASTRPFLVKNHDNEEDKFEFYLKDKPNISKMTEETSLINVKQESEKEDTDDEVMEHVEKDEKEKQVLMDKNLQQKADVNPQFRSSDYSASGFYCDGI